jgi:hypothetical protein
VQKAQIKGDLIPGNTLTADITGEENYTFNWICKGNVVSTEKQFTIPSDNSLDGQHIYLRAIDRDGFYATEKSRYPVTEPTQVNFGNVDSSSSSALLTLDSSIHKGLFIIVALYDSHDNFITASVVTQYNDYLYVKTDKTIGAANVKAFIFGNSSVLNPVCEPLTSVLE